MSYRQCTKCGKMAECRKYYRTCNDCLAAIEERKKAKEQSKKVKRHICPDCGNWVIESKYDLQKGKCLRCAAKYVWHEKPMVKVKKCKHCGEEFTYVGAAKWLCISCKESQRARYVILRYKSIDDYIIGKWVASYETTISVLPFDSQGVLLDKVISLRKMDFEPDSLKPLTKLSFQRSMKNVNVL